ncbi:MAG: hypothetical protein RR370_02780 [Synergistaceae bacterium]
MFKITAITDVKIYVGDSVIDIEPFQIEELETEDMRGGTGKCITNSKSYIRKFDIEKVIKKIGAKLMF